MVGAVVAAVANVPGTVVAAVANVPGTVVAAVTNVPRTVVAAVANVPGTVVATVAKLDTPTLVMEPMARMADVAGWIIGSVTRLRRDRNSGRGQHNDRRYCLGRAQSHELLPTCCFATHTMGPRRSETQ
jgi:hypothetical protein